MNIRYRIQLNPNPEPGQEAKGAHIRAITEGAVSMKGSAKRFPCNVPSQAQT